MTDFRHCCPNSDENSGKPCEKELVSPGFIGMILAARRAPAMWSPGEDFMKTACFSRSQRGFTLVEIAIVLVIIGLLLGGILKGQEMITQAKIKNVINDFN